MNAPEQSVQGTAEWFARRWGKFTGSRFADLMARNKKTGEKLKCWSDMVWTVAVERLTAPTPSDMDSYALRWGREVEPYGREAFELASGHFVEQVEFIDHPVLPYVGVSPDGLIGDDGGLEVKSPKDSRIHLARFDEGVPEEYVPQIQGCMWVTGRQWWSFVSYDPRMLPKLRMFHRVVERDDDYILKLGNTVIEAEAEVKVIVDKYLEMAK